MPTEWIKLDPAKLNQPHADDINGVTVSVLLSPFDVPTAVRGAMVANGGTYVIEFRYLDDEPVEPDRQPDGVIAHVGKKSGRLHGLEIPRALLGGDKVNLRVAVTSAADRTIDAMVQHVPPAARRANTVKGNFRVARDAIESASDRLIPA
ncbi:MAG TPA: hypothetical protein VF796_21865 [Humisphaera sp.]